MIYSIELSKFMQHYLGKWVIVALFFHIFISNISTAQDSKDQEIQALKKRIEKLEQDILKKDKAALPAENSQNTQEKQKDKAALPVENSQNTQEKQKDKAEASKNAETVKSTEEKQKTEEKGKSIEERVTTIEDMIKSTPLLSIVKDWQFGGNIQVSYNYNFNNPDNRQNYARFFDDKSNHFNFNQFVFWMEKPCTDDLPVGFNAEIFIGRDAKKTHSLGLGINQGDDPDDSAPIDLTQGYVTGKIPVGTGLEIKAGKFYGFCGYESVRRSINFHNSLGLLSTWATPTAQVGVLASYSFVDEVSLSFGVVNGWNNVEDNNDGKTLTGTLCIKPIKEFSLTISGMWGPEQDDETSEKRTSIDIIASCNPIPGLTLALNFDYGDEEDGVQIGGKDKRARWHSLAAYISYEITDSFSVGVRAEYFNDELGWCFGYVDPETGDPAKLLLWEITLTFRYQIFDHLFAGVEYRHDHARHGCRVFDSGSRTGVENKQDTLGFELMYQF